MNSFPSFDAERAYALALLADRDPVSQRRLIEELAPLVRRRVLKLLGNDSDADDIVQDAILRILDRLDRVLSADHLQGFVMKTVTFVVQEHFRSKRRRRWVFWGDAQNDYPATSENEGQLTTDEIYAALKNLPDEQRIVVTLQLVEECELSEIVEQTGFSRSTVNRHLAAARQKIKTALRGTNPLAELFLVPEGS